MLGANNQPSLLISVEQEYAHDHFDFWVVNGAWEGTFYNGYVTVHHPWNPHSSLDKTEILCNNQDRLRGDYQVVFDNFGDPNYVAPLPIHNTRDFDDDDIPF
jgi:hypothetical protein